MLLGGALVALPLAMSAQESAEKYSFRSHGFFQVQGGLHMPLIDDGGFKYISPSFGANLGAWFAPSLGARIGYEGWKSKAQWQGEKEDFNYFTIGADVLLNISPLLVEGNNPKGNLYILGGVGITHRGSQKWAGNKDGKLMHNLRVGLGYEYRFFKALSASLELRFNNTDDRFLPKLNGKDDWHTCLLAGLSYNFAYADKPYYTPAEPRKRDLSLYEQKEMEVNKQMNMWMRRLKGESKADFLSRTTGSAMQAQRLEYDKSISTNFGGNRITTNASGLTYNLGAEKLGVAFTDMPSIALSVPRADVGSFKEVKDLKFENTVYSLNPGDKFEVLYTEVINPATGKKYQYINQRDAQLVQGDGFVPIAAVHQDMLNNERLQAIRTNALAEANNSKDYQLDNNTISVGTELMPTAAGADYKVKYAYQANDGFSAKNDFAPGQYDADKSIASRALLQIISQSLADPAFSKYVQEGGEVDITYIGSADAKPVNSAIPYNGRYGNIKEQVDVNGQKKTLTVTKASGINSNEELSLVRAKSVRDLVMKNNPALSKMKVTENYKVIVSGNEGGEFRRVEVEMLFRNAFQK